ncbi:MAG: head GIN domain-containing protein [Bacteroidota bacterium]
MKTLNFKILLVGVLALTVLSSCMFNCIHGSGKEAKETRKVNDFTRINVSGGYNITLKQDSTLSLNITADDNVLKYITTNVDGDELRISTKKNICAKNGIAIIIGVRNLEAIKGSGAIEVTSDGKLNLKNMSLNLSGASKVNLDMNATDVITKGTGATEINLKGQAASHTVHLTGSGKVSALDFVVGKYDIETTGASECKINVLTDLNVHTTGASDIQYRGNPTNVNTSKAGASSVTKID